MQEAGGYDLSYLLNASSDIVGDTRRTPCPAAAWKSLTTSPAIVSLHRQLPGRDAWRQRAGRAIQKHAGVCLETGHLPDSVHHPAFPSIILRPADVSRACVYRFGRREAEGGSGVGMRIGPGRIGDPQVYSQCEYR